MKLFRSFIFIFLSGCFLGKAQSGYSRLVLHGGTVHTGNGKTIISGAVVITGSVIAEVIDLGKSTFKPAAGDSLISVEGKHVYPALINANNILGLHDAEAVRATVDFAEVGHINPHVRALIAYNTDNIIVPTVRTNGVLYTQVTPRAGLISGSSSVMGLHGWNWEDAVLKADDGIHLNFPQAVITRSGLEDNVHRDAQKHYEEEMEFLDRFFTGAASYCAESSHAENDIRFEAMRPVLAGRANLYVHANDPRNILAALAFVKRHRLQRPVLVGARGAHLVTAELKAQKVPVILGRVNDLPFTVDEDIDLPYTMPARLQRDSILFCIQMEGDMEAMHSRNLPFNAGVACGYGLDREAALSAVTINAARILGVDSIVGSLQAGKLASLVVSDGDILDMRSNNITLAFLSGMPVPLDNHQLQLYRKFRNKYQIK